MTGTVLLAVLILLSILSVNLVGCLMQESLGTILGTFAAIKQVRIPELLNQLCNRSQGSNMTRRDACYGCFYRASILPQGYSMLIAMSACANNYLNNTSYGHCQVYLRDATSTPNNVNPRIIYCTFLECIRQVNKDSLDIDIRTGLGGLSRGIARQGEKRRPFLFSKVPTRTVQGVCVIRETNVLIVPTARPTVVPPVTVPPVTVPPVTVPPVTVPPVTVPPITVPPVTVPPITVPPATIRECVGEAARMLPNFNNVSMYYTETQLVRLLVNTTACVLAKTRCSYVNPVTGKLQDDDIANKLHLPSLNAVLVNTDYDINIVQLPVHYSGVDVCTKYRNVQQAAWPGVTC